MPIIADDFGLNPEDDSVIIKLIKLGAIDGTSVLIKGNLSKPNITSLTNLRKKNNSQIGIHLNLTENLSDQVFHSHILSLWIKSTFRTVDMNMIEQELNQQLELFTNVFGFAPDFIDGHQHCHAIPALWDIIKKTTSKYITKNTWVRTPCPSTLSMSFYQVQQAGLKSLLVMGWGLILRKRLKKLNIKTNSNFMGLINYNTNKFKKNYMESLSKYHHNSVMMVHPGSSKSTKEILGHPTICREIETIYLLKRAEQS